MKLAYLLNTYPLISTTFIRREIEAIEAQGQSVTRYAVRDWHGKLVDPRDIAEARRTRYILTGGKFALLRDAALTKIRHPLKFATLLPIWWRLWRNAGGHFVQHCAYLIEALAFAERMRRDGITHVHVHFSTNAAAVAMLARHMGAPPYSFTVHGPDELIDPPSLSLAEKSRAAVFVVAITEYCRGRILAEAPDCADKVHVVHCGIDVEEFAYDPHAPEAPRIVCVGRLCHNKGQKHIPAALAQVRDEFPELVIDLLGGGEDEAVVRAEIDKHGVAGNIVLHGWASSDQVRAGIHAARALLLPSYAEGLPIVIMESFAMGRPVLTTRITGIPELVDASCGWLFEPSDVDGLAQALREAMRKTADERAAMGAEGRRRVEAGHDVHKCAAQLLALVAAADKAG